MQITLQHFESCPSWETTDRHLQDLIHRLDLDVEVQYQLIETPEVGEQADGKEGCDSQTFQSVRRPQNRCRHPEHESA